MKINKFFLILMAAVLAFSVSACTSNQKTYSLLSGSYWLSDPSVSEVGAVNETCVYDISFLPQDDDTPVKAEITGTLTTTLTRETYNDTPCYKFTAKVNTTGKYIFGQNEYPVEDEMSSECYFLGMSDKLFPLASSKTVNGLTPQKTGDVFTFHRVAYSVSTVYDYKNGKATVTVTPDDRSEKGYEVPKSERTYEKLSAKNTYFDNESLFMIARSCNLEAGFSARFTSIDALSGKANVLTLSVDTSAASKEISLSDYTLDGVTQGTEQSPKKITCDNVQIAISDTFSGNPLLLSYASDNANRKRLIEMTTYLPYLAGKLNYRLKSVTTK